MLSQFKLKINPEKIRFIALFIVLISAFYFLSVQFESYIPLFNMHSTANMLYTILKTIGVNSTIKSNILTFDNFSIQIIRQCTGIFEVIALSAVMLAYPASKEKKLAGIMISIPTIYLFNMLRLVFLSILGIYYQFLFDAVHEYFFQITFVFLVIFIWILWIEKVVKSEKIENKNVVNEDGNKNENKK